MAASPSRSHDSGHYGIGTRVPSGWVVARLGRARLVLAPSWLVVAGLLVLLVHPTVQSVTNSVGGTVATAGGFVAVLFITVLVHELAHGLSALRVGASPREYVVTFWGGHTSFEQEMRSPGASAWVSAAGPLANLALGSAVWGLTVAIHDSVPPSLWLLLWSTVLANGAVGLFNLLPGLPLDGGRVLEAALWAATGDRTRGAVAAGWAGRLLAVAVALLIVVWSVTTGEGLDVVSVIWASLLGAVLWRGATDSLRQARSHRAVEGLDLRDLATPAVVLPETATLADVEVHQRAEVAIVVVSRQGFLGMLDATAVAAVPRPARATTSLEAVSRTIPQEAIIRSFRGAHGVAAAARARRASTVGVLVQDQRVVGVLPIKRLLGELDRRSGTAAA